MSGRVLFALSIALLVAGCSHRQTADEALNQTLSQMGQSRSAVFPLAGKVTIDGQTPQLAQRRQRLLVVLNDPAKPDAKPLERPYVECNAEGEFAFRTYEMRDGVRPGNYVLTFAELTNVGKRGILGPDGLKNLYNDPDKAEFPITHQAPGRTDYRFDLKLEGREPAQPGPRSFQGVGERKVDR
ncbi:MAG TPA: hypothetical protein VMR25_28135 [Planctomycetaceae bacterium]|jgi:hypothetical protein|nr:hypothetical protein [Planctomycetaceae bacterium]